MCGSSDAQNNINQQQQAFYKQLTDQYQTEFGQNQAILKSLTDALTPLITAGPQQGFSPEETAALNTQATEQAAQAAAQTKQALNEGIAARGGGNNPNLTNPATAQLDEAADLAAQKQLSDAKLGITQNNYATGRQQFNNALGLLSGVPGSVQGANSSAASVATGAGDSAAQEANAINQSNNSWMGLLGGLAGNLTYTSGKGFGLGG